MDVSAIKFFSNFQNDGHISVWPRERSSCRTWRWRTSCRRLASRTWITLWPPKTKRCTSIVTRWVWNSSGRSHPSAKFVTWITVGRGETRSGEIHRPVNRREAGAEPVDPGEGESHPVRGRWSGPAAGGSQQDQSRGRRFASGDRHSGSGS